MAIFNTVYGGKISGIYYNSNLGLISLSSNGTDWITIDDKNLGATTVYNNGDTLSESNCGKQYQWGNNYGFPFTGTVTTSSTQVDASNYGPQNYYSSSTFITGNNWDTSNNDNLRGYINGTYEAMRGPCQSGFHVPTKDEFVSLLDIGISLGAWTSSSLDNLKSYLKLPPTGFRGQNGSAGYFQDRGFYWTTNTSINYGVCIQITSSRYSVQQNADKTLGYNIRPFKNKVALPDSSWTKLY